MKTYKYFIEQIHDVNSNYDDSFSDADFNGKTTLCDQDGYSDLHFACVIAREIAKPFAVPCIIVHKYEIIKGKMKDTKSGIKFFDGDETKIWIT